MVFRVTPQTPKFSFRVNDKVPSALLRADSTSGGKVIRLTAFLQKLQSYFSSGTPPRTQNCHSEGGGRNWESFFWEILYTVPNVSDGHRGGWAHTQITGYSAYPRQVSKRIWVVLQKLPQLSDTHFSQVLNKLEKIFFTVL